MEGIVWRLSRAVLDQDTVLLGPALEDGCTDVLSCDDLNLWGDKLSDHDLDLICGVYKVEGKSGMSFIYQDFSLTWPRAQGAGNKHQIHPGGQSIRHGFEVACISDIGQGNVSSGIRSGLKISSKVMHNQRPALSGQDL
jgi:hypothetical protein